VDRAAVLAFAVLESFENEDGDGDMWIKSVQLARAAVTRPGPLVADPRPDHQQMIPGELSDPYQADLVEKFWDVEDEYGEVDQSMKSRYGTPRSRGGC